MQVHITVAGTFAYESEGETRRIETTVSVTRTIADPSPGMVQEQVIDELRRLRRQGTIIAVEGKETHVLLVDAQRVRHRVVRTDAIQNRLEETRT